MIPGYTTAAGVGHAKVRYTADGVVCGCGSPSAGELSVVLDPFGGSGTTAHVASALGRYGVSLDVNGKWARLALDGGLAGERFRMVHGLRVDMQVEGQTKLF